MTLRGLFGRSSTGSRSNKENPYIALLENIYRPALFGTQTSLANVLTSNELQRQMACRMIGKDRPVDALSWASPQWR
jgi:hypothetical protein